MYQHVRVVIYDKQRLDNTIRELFNRCSTYFSIEDFHVDVIIDNLGDDDKFLLTDDQMRAVAKNTITTVSCNHDQIMQYAHSCLRVEQLMDIITGHR